MGSILAVFQWADVGWQLTTKHECAKTLREGNATPSRSPWSQGWHTLWKTFDPSVSMRQFGSGAGIRHIDSPTVGVPHQAFQIPPPSEEKEEEFESMGSKLQLFSSTSMSVIDSPRNS